MVTRQDDYRCVDIVFLHFTCRVSKAGPIEPSASSKLTSALEKLYKLPVCDSVHFGVDDSLPYSLILLFAHTGDKSRGTLDLSPYNNEEGRSPTENIKQVSDIIETSDSILVSSPVIFNTIFDCNNTREASWPDMRKPLPIDLFRIELRNELTDKWRFHPEECLSINNPLREKAFVQNWLNPPRRHFTPYPEGGCVRGYRAPVKHCLCVHTVENYARYPVSGEIIEQFCFLEWQSEKTRQQVKKISSEWWNEAFGMAVIRAEKEGDILDFEHWVVVLEMWYPRPRRESEEDRTSQSLLDRFKRFCREVFAY